MIFLTALPLRRHVRGITRTRSCPAASANHILREFDHRLAHPSVAVFSDPLFTFAPAAEERRSAKPDVSGDRASIAKLPHECLTHEKRSEVRTDRPQVRQRADHPFRLIHWRVLLENAVTRQLHLFNQAQNEIKAIEQTFDTRLGR